MNKTIFVLLAFALTQISCTTKERRTIVSPIVTGAIVYDVGLYTKNNVMTFGEEKIVGGSRNIVSNIKLVKKTHEIPAKIGNTFGFRFRVLGEPENAFIKLTIKGFHPPIKDPRNGNTFTHYEYERGSTISNTFNSFSFDNEWEVVPGEWRIEVWHKGKKLCEQTFNIITEA